MSSTLLSQTIKERYDFTFDTKEHKEQEQQLEIDVVQRHITLPLFKLLKCCSCCNYITERTSMPCCKSKMAI